MHHGAYEPPGNGVSMRGNPGKLHQVPSMLNQRGANRFYALGQRDYRFVGYKTSILQFLLGTEWRMSRLIISDGKGFTRDDECGTVAKMNPSIVVRGSEVAQTANEMIIDTIRGAAMGFATGVGGGAILGGLSQALDVKDALSRINNVGNISQTLSEAGNSMNAPNKAQYQLDHRLGQRIIIQVGMYMPQGRSKFAAKVVDTQLTEINFSQLAAVVSGLP